MENPDEIKKRKIHAAMILVVLFACLAALSLACTLPWNRAGRSTTGVTATRSSTPPWMDYTLNPASTLNRPRTAEVTGTRTLTQTVTATLYRTESKTPNKTTTATWSLVNNPTRTAVFVPSKTITRTPTVTRTRTRTVTRTPTSSVTSTTTDTPTPTGTPTPTDTSTPTETKTPTATVTPEIILFSARPTSGTPLDIFQVFENGMGLQSLVHSGEGDSIIWDILPDGSQMVYEAVRGDPPVRQLFLSNTDGTDPLAVPFQPAGENNQASYSPNGTWLVFRNYDGTQVDLWIIKSNDPDGTSLRKITNDLLVESLPDWYTAGILYSVGGDIFTIPLVDPLADPLPASAPILTTVMEESWPRISPDGSTMAYTSFPVGDPADIFSLKEGMITSMVVSPGDDDSPSWTADGSRLLFLSNRTWNVDLIYVLNISNPLFPVPVPVNIQDPQNPMWLP